MLQLVCYYISNFTTSFILNVFCDSYDVFIYDEIILCVFGVCIGPRKLYIKVTVKFEKFTIVLAENLLVVLPSLPVTFLYLLCILPKIKITLFH